MRAGHQAHPIAFALQTLSNKSASGDEGRSASASNRACPPDAVRVSPWRQTDWAGSLMALKILCDELVVLTEADGESLVHIKFAAVLMTWTAAV